MHWSTSTISVLKKLHNNDKYNKWNNAIQKGDINEFSDDLENLLHRLAGVLITELEINPKEKEKLIKLLELAAIGGKTL
jgi:hypothetical protein